MRERSGLLIGLIVALLLLFPLGYLIHVAPRFPGSLAGGLIGIAAALLMVLTLPLIAAKRSAWLDRRLSPHVARPTLLALHSYAGALAGLLGLVHAAHTFSSPLGVTVTGLLILTVLSGYVGRYFLAQSSRAIRARWSELASLKAAILGLPPLPVAEAAPARMVGWKRFLFVPEETAAPQPRDREALAAALADAEYAVRAEEATNVLLSRWRLVHIIVGSLLYIALLLHIGAALYFGLRWL